MFFAELPFGMPSIDASSIAEMCDVGIQACDEETAVTTLNNYLWTLTFFMIVYTYNKIDAPENLPSISVKYRLSSKLKLKPNARRPVPAQTCHGMS